MFALLDEIICSSCNTLDITDVISLNYSQLFDFFNDHNILEIFQSGFKTLHSTESALLRVFNDIFLATDSGHSVILVLLDLTAAFDTVDHDILIARLEQWVGIRGQALAWFRSYLSHRSFCVGLGDCVLHCTSLLRGSTGLSVGPAFIFFIPSSTWVHSKEARHFISLLCG